MQGGGGNYSKDKACNLPDGTYGYNLQIANYPGYDTFIKNFVKSKGTLYYVISASPIEGEFEQNGERLHSERLLWSWDCKSKRANRLSEEIYTYYSQPSFTPYKSVMLMTDGGTPLPQVTQRLEDFVPRLGAEGSLGADFVENSIEIDYLSKDFFVLRYKMKYRTCVRFDFTVSSNSTIDNQGCADYRDIVHFRHVVLDREDMSQTVLGFDPNEENYENGIRLVTGYKPFATALQEKYTIISCEPNIPSIKKNTAGTYKMSEYASIPPGSKCTYPIFRPYVVDVSPSGKNVKVSIKFGDGISGYSGFMESVKLNLMTRKIIK